MAYSDIEVVQLAQGYFIEITKDGGSGQKVFMLASQYPNANATKTTLPSIGDEWSTEYPNLKVTAIDTAYINEDRNCGILYSVQYNVYQEQDFQNGEDTEPPITMDMSANYITYSTGSIIKKTGGDDSTNSWANTEYNATDDELATMGHMVWNSDNKIAADIKMQKREVNIQIRVHKMLMLDELAELETLSEKKIGKVNSDTPLNSPKGALLYQGADVLEGADSLGRRRYTTILKFLVNVKNGQFVNDFGHNWFLRPGFNDWDKPLLEGSPIYDETTMQPILDLGKKTPDLLPNPAVG